MAPTVQQRAGVLYILTALHFYRRTGSGNDDCSLAKLPHDVLEVISLWVLHGHLGMVGCCRHGYSQVLIYVAAAGATAGLRGPAEAPTEIDVGAALCAAATHGHMACVRYLLDTHSSCVTPEALEASLVSASEHGRLAVVQCLVGWASHHGVTFPADSHALPWACQRGHTDIVKILVEEAGSDPRAVADRGLRYAAENGHLDIARYMIGLGADVGAQDNYALRWASASGYLDMVRFLCENGADVNSKDEFALRRASEGGHLGIVEFLVERGGDVRALSGKTFALVGDYGHADVLDYLARHGAR